jgi:lathosterol oxidase
MRLDYGWLEYVVCSPRYHRWHHARDEAYADANYAIHLPVIDMAMGTFRRPPPKTWPAEYGVMEMESVPSGFWAQHAMPFGRRRTFERYVGGEILQAPPPKSGSVRGRGTA